MPKYKITTGSVETKGDNTHLEVTFIRDNEEASHPQRFEVASLDESKIYAELDKAALSWENLTATKGEVLGEYNLDVPAPVPVLVENESLAVGVETKKALTAKETPMN